LRANGFKICRYGPQELTQCCYCGSFVAIFSLSTSTLETLSPFLCLVNGHRDKLHAHTAGNLSLQDQSTTSTTPTKYRMMYDQTLDSVSRSDEWLASLHKRGDDRARSPFPTVPLRPHQHFPAFAKFVVVLLSQSPRFTECTSVKGRKTRHDGGLRKKLPFSIYCVHFSFCACNTRRLARRHLCDRDLDNGIWQDEVSYRRGISNQHVYGIQQIKMPF
jgi:hypothetical protein